MSEDFGIGGRVELMPLVLELVSESIEVFNDAVMNHGDAPRGIEMGMRILMGGIAMSGPSGVTDSRVAVSGGFGQEALKPMSMRPCGLRTTIDCPS